jgi:hypothetical protein
MSDLEMRRLVSIARHKITDLLPEEITDKEIVLFYNLLIECIHHELTRWSWDDVREERNEE